MCVSAGLSEELLGRGTGVGDVGGGEGGVRRYNSEDE